MDLYQGSTPLNFIPFRLESLSEENTTPPTKSQASHPAASDNPVAESEGLPPEEISNQIARPQGLVEHGSPFHSQDSDVDVTTYAESGVNRIKQMQTSTSQDKDISGTAPVPSEFSDSNPAALKALTAGEPRSSTPHLVRGGRKS